MNHLYSRSRWTIAILSVTLNTTAQLSGLTAVLYREDLRGGMLHHELEAMTHTLDRIMSDMWFTRTWTMHEQYCTRIHSLRLLLTVHPGLRMPDWATPSVHDDDLDDDLSLCWATPLVVDNDLSLSAQSITYSLNREIDHLKDISFGIHRTWLRVIVGWQRRFNREFNTAMTLDGFPTTLSALPLEQIAHHSRLPQLGSCRPCPDRGQHIRVPSATIAIASQQGGI